MDELIAIAALSALAQPTRLAAFRRLAAEYPGEIAAGALARHCRAPHNTMSSHLAALARAGLVKSARHGRTVRYSADMERLRALVAFLALDCCDGRPELCLPVLDALSASCRTSNCNC